jgi:hypothetical protein
MHGGSVESSPWGLIGVCAQATSTRAVANGVPSIHAECGQWKLEGDGRSVPLPITKERFFLFSSIFLWAHSTGPPLLFISLPTLCVTDSITCKHLSHRGTLYSKPNVEWCCTMCGMDRRILENETNK